MEKGFFGSLFDVSFSSLITTKVIKVLYVLSMVIIGLTALAFIGGAFAQDPGFGVLMLVIIAPLFSLLYLIYTRVILEVLICLFRIMETNVELVQLQRASATSGPPTTPMAAPERPASPPPATP